MKRPGFIASILAAGCVSGPSVRPGGDVKPNVILMMADDMGLGDTSAYQDFTGNGDVDQLRTPNMERLARMGVRFTDAHTPSSRCTPTRYALLTGRYPWRNRLKYWVLFGAQGDPMIEADRPTVATMLRGEGYSTMMVGKWHVGLRYRRADGKPAAGWKDADLTQPLADTPLDHGFDRCRITSRSHGTSGPGVFKKNRNTPNQKIGPGHVHGRNAIGATPDGKKLTAKGPTAYVLKELGGRHSDSAIRFLEDHVSGVESRDRPFFLYYACNSNHGPYTPDDEIAGVAVKGAGRNVAGKAMDVRADFIYENDVALGRMIDWLEGTDDPRNPEKKLIRTTIVIFTSDNGAERAAKSATGPFRSNKGSVYEGGHRVPFIVAWSGGGVGDGDASDPGRTDDSLIGLQDLYATFAEVVGRKLPDLRTGAKGAEDSFSMLAAWRGGSLPTPPMIFNDHKEAKDGAAAAIRQDAPVVDGRTAPGKWKLFADGGALRRAVINPVELYDLSTDPREERNRIREASLKPLVNHLAKLFHLHRTVGGSRVAAWAPKSRIVFDWRVADDSDPGDGTMRRGLARGVGEEVTAPGVKMNLTATRGTLEGSGSGLGVKGGASGRVDGGEALLIRFDRDVIVESASIIAGKGTCGGFYRMGDAAPLAIYCVDADNDSKDQRGILGDLGVLKAGRTLRLDSGRHFGVESAGSWRLQSLAIRVLEK